MQRVLDELFFINKKLDQFARTHLFQILRARIALFGQGRGQILEFIQICACPDRSEISCFRGQPGSAQFGRPLGGRDPRIGKIFLQPAPKCMGINGIALKQAADQNHFRRKEMETRGNDFNKLTQTTRAFFYDLHHARVAVGGGFKNHRRECRNLHLVGGLRPAHQLVEIVQRQGVQHFGRELDLAAVQIVFAQNQAERLN